MKQGFTHTTKACFVGGYLSRAINHAIHTHWKNRSSISSALLLTAGVATTMIVAPAQAQQITGSVKGTVTAPSGSVSVSGVTVTATSDVMPKPRTATTRPDGSYSLLYLLPGYYELTFTFADGSVRKTSTQVLLEQASVVDLAYQPAETEVIEIYGSAIITEGDSSLSNSFGEDVISNMPVGQSYREMLKILPGVEYTENGKLGPSAGGSGVDNSYALDGVDLSLPMFGNLSSEPATHDIAYLSVDRGGAKAIGFNRAGGFSVNSTSKSGTNEFHGSLEYRLQNADFTATPEDGVISDVDQSWIIGSLSGPIIEDTLYFYGSYYRPEETGEDKVTAYGPAKSYKSTRDEYFGKLTWAPTEEILLNASHRVSDKEITGASIGEFETDDRSQGSESKINITSIDGSWLVGDASSFTFKYAKYKEEGATLPDVMLNFTPVMGDALDSSDLASQGAFGIQSLRDYPEGADAATMAQYDLFNSYAQQYINQYGYVGDDGELSGGGGVGVYPTIDSVEYSRESFQVGFDTELYTGNLTHMIHLGARWSELGEDLRRVSNGWGSIAYVGGLGSDGENDVSDVFYEVSIEAASFNPDGTIIPSLKSSSESIDLEFNDEIQHGDFTYNIGFLLSQDTLYGQGLRENSNNLSGYELAPGEKYEMYKTDWKDMFQPRLGVKWEYQDGANVFANYASYNPNASSLARAASWDRNIRGTLLVHFDENGEYLAAGGAPGSSGKFFADNLRPRRIDEWTLGTSKLLTNQFFVRSHLRYRYGSHFWEDMPNGARLYGEYGPAGGVPENIAAKGLYIPNLDDMRAEVGGSSYVIAEVDDGQTKYWEWSVEGEYNNDKVFVNASYVWSHYYGNFDQDNTSTGNDANLFIGSSNYGDGPGRMPWDFRYGNLAGDKPHKVKINSTYTTDWDGVLGAFFIFQSGGAWTAWDGTPYGYSSSTTRYAEPAGTRRDASHWQLDLSYTQYWEFVEGYTARFRADLFNVFDNQTGYSANPLMTSELFGQPRNFYNPRRIQLAVGIEF
ncbi:TonB-dependent receptor [Alteromonas confluentis]|uniref:TonB-dependent receptor n=1 Tax=Alteromonas confluentis TaxID=1656094 RepID=UPI0009F53D2B|nr:TonB-dependent receptor [Alteromonas confluentis]